jgi:hypothetical protein
MNTQPTLSYDARAHVFALITPEPDGSETVELFTAPGDGPFNVMGVDVSAMRNVIDN